MLSAVQSLLKVLMGYSDKDTVPGNIAAKILEINGDNALLQTGNRRFHARLSVQAKVGETLLLKPEETSEGILYCRVLQRFPLSEAKGEGLCPNVYSALIYPGNEDECPSFLTVKAGDERKTKHGIITRSWKFTLHTLSMGVVVLQVKKSDEEYYVGLMLESASALKNMKEIMPRLEKLVSDGDTSRFIWQKPRLMTSAEVRNATETGSSLNFKL